MFNLLFCIFIISNHKQYSLGHSILKEISTCSNFELQKLGCKCSSDYTEQSFLFNSFCENGLNKLSCEFKSPYNKYINYFDLVSNQLNQMSTSYCWYEFQFTNVIKIQPRWLSKVNLVQINKYSNLMFSFRHLNEIDSFSFEYENVAVNTNFIIRLDSTIAFDFNNQPLILNEFCFSNIKNCKLLELKNFNNIIDLKASLFVNSNIETILISFSKYNGILNDLTRTSSVNIKNIVIHYCNLEKIDYNTLGSFDSLTNARIENSNIEYIDKNAFQYCCLNLKQLHLNNNQIKSLYGKNVFSGLNNLAYLNLESNPIDLINKNVMDPFRTKLRKLNLDSTKFIRLNDFFFGMNQLEELILSKTPFLEFDNIGLILTNSPKLKYLDLKDSYFVRQNSNLNKILDRIEFLLKYQMKNTLSFIDLTHSNIHIDSQLFGESFEENDQCLWNSLLQKTFIQVDENHQCTCGLFYLYRYILFYEFPYELRSVNSESEINDQFLHQYFKINTKLGNITDWQHLMLKFPKCYRQLWLQDFSLDLIRIRELECGFWPIQPINLNCSNQVKTTKKQTTYLTSFTSSSTKPIQSTIAKNTTELFISKKFSAEFTIPIVLTLFVLWIIIITLLVYKARYDYKRNFLMKTKRGLSSLTNTDSKAMNNLTTISSNINMFNDFDESSFIEDGETSLISFGS